MPKIKCLLKMVPSPLCKSTHVLIVNSLGKTDLVETTRSEISTISKPFMRFVAVEPSGKMLILTMDYRRNRFIMDFESSTFVPLHELLQLCMPNVKDNMKGLTSEMHAQIKCLMGANALEIDKKSRLVIFFEEVVHPFNIFQLASFAVWIFENYYLYAMAILIMSVSSILITVYETKQNLDKMCEMTRFVCQTRVFRDEKFTVACSDSLVPGDILVINEAIDLIPCDAVLVNGDAIVDESMLTGETVPVSKLDINDDDYVKMLNDNEEDQKYALYAGTKLLRSRPRHGQPAMALVTRTGFLTTKGGLVQSILFPRPNNFRFYRDSMIFVGILGCIAAVGFSVAIVNFVALGTPLYYIISRALDVITVVVPPALPATMAIGTVFAIKRLERLKIYCISPPKINVASKIDVMCFDKTGTLTEDGLEICGILPVPVRQQFSPYKFQELVHSMDALLECAGRNSEELLILMATCHSVRRVNGRLLGDSLDLRMLEFTGWELEELLDVGEAIMPTVIRPPGSSPFDVKGFIAKKHKYDETTKEMGIIRQFDFSAKLRRMSVISKRLAAESPSIYTKGSPESLLEICTPESIPEDYNELLAFYAHHGYRVIACARKACPGLSWIKAQRMAREQAESDLTFMGFIIFENRMKPETAPTIAALKMANLEIVMATGDNILTSISVGRACGIIGGESRVFYPDTYADAKAPSHVAWKCVDDIEIALDPLELAPVTCPRDYCLAVSGDFFEWMLEHMPKDLQTRILSKCSIFARMSPVQKQLLVEVLQQRPATIGFCGDGANDCGALKAADVGISLSQAEASIAAPFTSKIQDISCVPRLLMEGRASLVTSLSCFKYMTLYSMIQFTSLIFVYAYGYTMSDGQFVFVDLGLIVPLGILMSRYAPAKKLSAYQPVAKLLCPEMLTIIIGHIIIQGLFQLLIYTVLGRPAAEAFTPVAGDEEKVLHPTSTIVFMFSCFLYIATAIIFSAGRPFRQRVYWPFVVFATGAIAAATTIMFVNIPLLTDYLKLYTIDTGHKRVILLAAAIYFGVAYLFDRHLAPSLSHLF